jgi:hypothetical protein
MLLDLNEGQIPLNAYAKLKQDEFIRDNPKEVVII